MSQRESISNTMSKIYQHMGEGLSRPSSTAHIQKGMPAVRPTTMSEQEQKEIIYLKQILKVKPKLIAKHYGISSGRVYRLTNGPIRKHLHVDPEYQELKEEMESIGFPAKWENMKMLLEDW